MRANPRKLEWQEVSAAFKLTGWLLNITSFLPLANMKTESIYNVEEATFDKLVIAKSHEAPVLVDISAEWCAPCRVLGPLLHKLADAYGGKFLLALVDADENMRIAGRHKVRGFPTVIAYSRGEEIDRFHSAQTEGYLRNFLDSVIKRHAEVK